MKKSATKKTTSRPKVPKWVQLPKEEGVVVLYGRRAFDMNGELPSPREGEIESLKEYWWRANFEDNEGWTLKLKADPDPFGHDDPVDVTISFGVLLGNYDVKLLADGTRQVVHKAELCLPREIAKMLRQIAARFESLAVFTDGPIPGDSL